ncbi:MAG: anti-sigma factor [Flavobacterium sp.]
MDIAAYISSGIIEEYALGQTTQEENSILECVMKHNSEVAEAVLEAQEILGDLAIAQRVEPSSDLKNKIAAQLTFNDAESVLTEESKVVQMSTDRSNTKSGNNNFWAIAASLLLLLSLGWNILNTNSKNTEIESLSQSNDELKTQADAIAQENNLLLNSDKIKLLGVETHPELYATVLYSADNQVFLKLDKMPKAPEGKEYQLWAIVDGKPVDLGMYDENNSQKLQAMKTISKPQAFAITLENKGGSPTPTMEQMYVLGNVG